MPRSNEPGDNLKRGVLPDTIEGASLDRLYSGMPGGIGRIYPNRGEVSCPKVLIIGINPSGDERVKRNSALHRLAYWVEFLGLRDGHHFTNCILVPGGYELAAVDFGRLRELKHKYDKIIALGGFPSEALKRVGASHFKMPHPSPRNRQLNDPVYEQKMLNDCAMYLAE